MPHISHFPYVRKVIEVLCLIFTLIGVIMVAVSMDHDRKWNEWVDQNFNLNHKNSQQLHHIDDYIDTESQHDWIGLLIRDNQEDKLYFTLSIFSACLLIVHLAGCTPSETDVGLIQGITLYAIAGTLMICSASLLTKSLVDIDNNEQTVSQLVNKMENSQTNRSMRDVLVERDIQNFQYDLYDEGEGSGPSGDLGDYQPELVEQVELDPEIGEMISMAVEVGHSIRDDVYCRTDKQSTSAFKEHCQLFGLKIAAIIFGFLSALGCYAVAWIFLVDWWSVIKEERGAVARIKRESLDQEVPEGLSGPSPGRYYAAVSPEPPKKEEIVERVKQKSTGETEADYRRRFMEQVYGDLVPPYQPHLRSSHDDDYK